MSTEKYCKFWCLGEAGWIAIQNEDCAPEDCVRIYEEQVYQGSPFGKESRRWSLLKMNPSWTRMDADALESKFPRPEQAKTLSDETLKALQKSLKK
jgi:hypothetical protein